MKKLYDGETKVNLIRNIKQADAELRGPLQNLNEGLFFSVESSYVQKKGPYNI